MEELAAAQKRTEETVAALNRRMEELAEAQKRTEETVATLSQRMEELAAAQKRTEETVAALNQRMEELAAAQKRTEETVAALSQRVDNLAQAQEALTQTMERLGQRVEELTEAQRTTEVRLTKLENTVQVLVGHVDQLRGWSLEYRYQRHAPAYLLRLLRHVHVLAPEDLARLLEEAEERGVVSQEEVEEVLRADLVCSGRLQKGRKQKAWAVVEVSWVVGEEDVRRAADRAAAWQKVVSEPVLAVAAGQQVAPEVVGLACMLHVHTLTPHRPAPAEAPAAGTSGEN
jgi:prefoldin subunit 5